MEPLLGKTRPSLGAFVRSLWQRPGAVRQILAAQGPSAASGAARWYSLTLLRTAFVLYLAMSFILGLLQVPIGVGGRLNLGQPLVVLFAVMVGAFALAMLAAGFWALGLAIMALFATGESTSQRLKALMWSIVLLLFLAGFALGFAESVVQT